MGLPAKEYVAFTAATSDRSRLASFVLARDALYSLFDSVVQDGALRGVAYPRKVAD